MAASITTRRVRRMKILIVLLAFALPASAQLRKPDRAALFRRSGARLVMPSAQHHDNFAMWDSDATPFNAKKMGPNRDLIGELATAVRKAGMKFGVSNHGVENFTFINPPADLDARLKAAHADLYDPAWASSSTTWPTAARRR